MAAARTAPQLQPNASGARLLGLLENRVDPTLPTAQVGRYMAVFRTPSGGASAFVTEADNGSLKGGW